MGEQPTELPQDRWFWVWLSVFTILFGTSPFVIWQGHPWWGSACGVAGLAGLLILVRDRLKAGISRLPIRTLLKVFVVVALSVIVGQLLGYNIYNPHANPSLIVPPVVVFVGTLGLVVLFLLLFVLVYLIKPRQSPIENYAPKLVIHRAVYAAGLPTEVSVTDKLQNMVRDGIAITVDGTLGGLLPHDPAFGVCKRLDMDYSYGSDTRFRVSRWERPPGEIMRLVLPEDTEVKRLVSEAQRLTPATPKIVRLSDRVEYDGTAAAYPLKLRIHLRNDSTVSVDIQLQEYRPELVTLMGFPTEVLQIRLRDSWYPKDHGAGRIALYPGQQFEAWIAPDDGKFNKAQVEGHRGRIGTLILLVNGQNVEIKL